MAHQKSWFRQEQRWKSPEKMSCQCQQERTSEQTSQKRTTEKKKPARREPEKKKPAKRKLGWRFPRVLFRSRCYF